METINKFYLNNEKIEDVNEFNEDSEKGSIIYEVLRVINGKAVFLKDHIERMKRSFALINMEFPFNTEDVEKKVNEVIKKNDNVLGNIKITYNTASKNLKIYYIKHSYPSNELYTEGVKTILYYGERENPNAKIVNDNFRAKVTEEIKKSNTFEAILVDRNGLITEGSKSNIFAIKDGKLITAKAEAVLKGITRDKIIDIAKEIGTYDTSILPYEDCCTIFVPKHPKTKPQLEAMRKAESVLDVEEMVRKAIEGTELVVF